MKASNLQLGLLLVQLLMICSATIQNCDNEVNGKCVACTKGFSLNNLGSSCLDNTKSNCALYLDDAGKQCAICQCGYSLTSSGACVKAAIKNCAFQDTAGTKCLLCRSSGDGLYGGGITDYGASFDKTACIDNAANKNPRCLEYAAGDITCNKCAKGFLPNSAGVCTKLLTPDLWTNNCYMVDDTGVMCLKCQVGYTLDLKDANFVPSNPCTEDTNYDTKCLRYQLGFDGVTYDFTQCIQCKWGYFLGDNFQCSLINRYTDCSTGKAINILNPVLDTGDLTKCNVVPSSDLPNLTADCILYIEHTYDTSTKVQTCLERKSAKIANNCADLDPTTLQCSSSNACFDGKSYDSAYKTCQASNVEGCLITNGLGWCDVCLNGYSAQEGRCFLNPAYNPNCKTWDGDLCTACNEGYGDAPSCAGSPSIARCTVMSGGKCVRCSNRGYILNEAGTECQTQFGGVPFCQTHSADYACEKCYDTFTLSPDKKSCWKQLKNCNSLSAEGVCAKCSRFDHALKLYPDSSYSCVPMTTTGSYCDMTMDGVSCETCKTHPNISTKPDSAGTLLCKATGAIIEGCLEFTDATTCQTCEWDYILTTDKQCYSLQQYRDLFAFQSSLWKDLEPCVEASNVNTCTKCDPTRDAGLLTFAAQSLNQATGAVEMIAGGVICVDNNRNHFNTDTTKNNVQNCVRYADETDLGACTTCRDNYTFTDASPDTCTNAKDPNNLCETMTAAGCTKCRNPQLYPRLIDGQCFSIDESAATAPAVKACKTFVAASTSQCSECYPSTYLDPSDQICKSYASVSDSNLNAICTEQTLDADTNNYLCSKCSKGYVLKSISSTANSVTTQKAFCVPDSSLWTSCVTYRTNGLCYTCQTGMKLKGSYDANQLLSQTCFYEVPNCVQYELNTYAYCVTCQAPYAPDAYGRACVTEKTAVPHCLAHSRSDPTQCAICESGFTAPACTGTPFCYVQNRDINGNILASCSVCVTGYIKTLTGACVLQRVNNCEIAYDSFLCAKCKDGYNNVYNQAHEVSPWFSACDVSETKGCALAGTDGKCARCRFAEYGMINGACVANDGSADYPVYCAEYRYNQTLKKLQCNRCENGYGLSQDNSYCVFNNQPCGSQNCYQYETAVAFDAQNVCSGDGYSNSSILAFTLLVSLFLAFYL